MTLEVWIAALPSRRNGAGTELDHLIDLFRDHEVAIHLVPLGGIRDPAAAESCRQRGCELHEFQPGIFRDRIVLSFADTQFIRRLPEIAATGRPARTIWFNSSVVPFQAELDAHAAGLIDVHGFVSDYQRSLLLPALAERRPVTSFDYHPYLNLKRVEWRYRSWDGRYAVGRISRDHPLKYPRDTWRMFERVAVPPPLTKQVNILGFGRFAAGRIGRPPRGLSCQVWRPNEISPTEFYRGIDTLLYRVALPESYGRVIVEACAHGVVPVVQNEFAFLELIRHGETGFLGDSSDALADHASYLAAHPRRHFAMARTGRAHMEALMQPEHCWRAWPKLLKP